jgi:hypothetical protein
MPAKYEIAFLPNGPKLKFSGTRGNYYEFQDGRRLELHTDPVWCRNCKKVTHGEVIDSIEKIDDRIANLERLAAEIRREMTLPPLPEPNAPGDREQREQIAEWKLRRQWRLQRRSPPRCIICGSIDIVAFPLDQVIPNPAGEGSVTMTCTGLCSTSFNEWFFTPEGERIPRDTKPTYWRHPGQDILGRR